MRHGRSWRLNRGTAVAQSNSSIPASIGPSSKWLRSLRRRPRLAKTRVLGPALYPNVSTYSSVRNRFVTPWGRHSFIKPGFERRLLRTALGGHLDAKWRATRVRSHDCADGLRGRGIERFAVRTALEHPPQLPIPIRARRFRTRALALRVSMPARLRSRGMRFDGTMHRLRNALLSRMRGGEDDLHSVPA